jgi:hypothetical protein
VGQPQKKGARPDPGFQLRQIHEVLLAHGASSTIRVVADDTDLEKIRQELVANLMTAGDFVVVNYHRPALGQAGGGHISPVAAYDEASDSFLIMDVNTTKQVWVWVKTAALVKSMRTRDRAENRGYLLVKEGPEKVNHASN